MAATSSQPSTAYGNNGIIVLGLLVGFVAIPVIAEVNAEMINGFLVLLLIGIILFRSDQWLPLFAQFGNVGSAAVAKRSTHPVANPATPGKGV